MDEDNVILCTAAKIIVVRKKFFDGSRSISLVIRSHSSVLHIYMSHVETFLSARGHTQKNINITTCSIHVIWLVGPFDKVGWGWMKIENVRFYSTLSDGVEWCFRGWYTIRHPKILSYRICRWRHVGPCIIWVETLLFPSIHCPVITDPPLLSRNHRQQCCRKT